MSTLPARARIVVVGGGIAGCSTAYHLAKGGCTDVLLLEQGKLTSGTTWHAAGLVGQMRPNRNMTQMSQYGIGLYASLEAETGLATGWKQCGSVNVASTPARMKVLKKQASLARSFGVECHVISPSEVKERYPIIRSDDLEGGLWLPGDGKANPADLCMSLAKGARMRGVTIVEGVEVVSVLTAPGPTGTRVTGVRVRVREGDAAGDEVTVQCEALVNCAGQWARQFGALAGVTVPLFSAEHFYVVTGKIEGVHPMLPVMRDPDGLIYYKEEVGGLVMGGFEMEAKPWKVDPIPSDFQFQLLDEDWDQFEPLMRAAIHRTPCLETADIKMLLNGPESFTPDGNFILGEAPELRNYFVCAGFNSAGIANSGGAGRLMAEWILAGAPPSDLWDVDVRRFAPFMGNRRMLAQRTGETLGLHYAMRWPRQELTTARPLRTSPLYDLLAAKGAEFGAKNGWERVNYFRPPGQPVASLTLDKPDWLPWMMEEQRATRESVAIYDQSSFGKLLLTGRDALAVLQKLCANEMDVPVGQITYTPMLNERGGIESDVTVTRLAPFAQGDQFFIMTGSAQPTRDMDWIGRHIGAEQVAWVQDVTTQWCVLSLMGPRSRELLAKVSPDDLSPVAFKFGRTKEIDLGLARVRAARMSYVGGLGFELVVPVEVARHVYLTLWEAGQELGLRDAGYFALDALRIEMGRRAWGAELGPDETPLEAGLLNSIRLDKQTSYLGQRSLREKRGLPLRKKLVTVVLDSDVPYAWGGEAIVWNGVTVGELSSAGWSHHARRCVGLGYVRGDAAQTPHQGSAAHVELWGEPVHVRLYDQWPNT